MQSTVPGPTRVRKAVKLQELADVEDVGAVVAVRGVGEKRGRGGIDQSRGGDDADRKADRLRGLEPGERSYSRAC